MFNRTAFPLTSYQDVPQNRNLGLVAGGLSNRYFKWPLFTAFSHELRHVKPFNLQDVNYPNSYGWQNVAQMTPDDGLDNAESHMYLDILSELQSRHWRLAAESPWRGVLVYDPSIS